MRNLVAQFLLALKGEAILTDHTGSNSSDPELDHYQLLRQREHIDGVVAGGHVGFGRQTDLGSRNRASPGGNGNILPPVDRISDGAANRLRGKARLPNELAGVGIERPQVMIQATVE